MEKERKGNNAHSVNTLVLVEHNILDCSYRWHLSLKVERDRFLSRFLTSHKNWKPKLLLHEYVAGCEVVEVSP